MRSNLTFKRVKSWISSKFCWRMGGWVDLRWDSNRNQTR